MEKILILRDTPHLLPKVYGLYAHENVYIYGQPLNELKVRLSMQLSATTSFFFI